MTVPKSIEQDIVYAGTPSDDSMRNMEAMAGDRHATTL